VYEHRSVLASREEEKEDSCVFSERRLREERFLWPAKVEEIFPVYVTRYSAFRIGLFYDSVSNKSMFRVLTQLIVVVIYRCLTTFANGSDRLSANVRKQL
jgi:hypothetical protein